MFNIRNVAKSVFQQNSDYANVHLFSRNITTYVTFVGSDIPSEVFPTHEDDAFVSLVALLVDVLFLQSH